MELVRDSTIMKRRPLFLSFFYTLFPAITTCVVVLILAVNYSTERFYETIIQQELKNRASNIFNWMKTTDLKSTTIQKICFESSNYKSVRITVVNKLCVVNHLNRPELKESLSKGFGLANRYSNTLEQE